MKLKELKEWISTLPDKYLEYDVVNAEIGPLDDDDNYTYRLDKPIVMMAAFEYTEEILLLNENPKDIGGYSYSKYEANPSDDEQLDN